MENLKTDEIIKSLFDEDFNRFLNLFKDPANPPEAMKVTQIIKEYESNHWGHSPLQLRDAYIKKYGFFLVCKESIEALKSYIGNRKVLEVMGGTGYLSRCLSDAGVNIICSDTNEWKNTGDFVRSWKEVSWYNVEEAEAMTALYNHRDVDVVLVSWPPYCDDTDVSILYCCEQHGKTLIYIGESEGGCTGSDEFFDTACTLQKENKVKTNMGYFLNSENNELDLEFPTIQFPGLHDQIFVVEPIKEGK